MIGDIRDVGFPLPGILKVRIDGGRGNRASGKPAGTPGPLKRKLHKLMKCPGGRTTEERTRQLDKPSRSTLSRFHICTQTHELILAHTDCSYPEKTHETLLFA